MNIVRRMFEIDAATDARLNEIATRRGENVGTVIAEAVALLGLADDIEGPDLNEDRRRLRKFKRTQECVPLDEVRAWTESWGTENELPRPQPRKLG